MAPSPAHGTAGGAGRADGAAPALARRCPATGENRACGAVWPRDARVTRLWGVTLDNRCYNTYLLAMPPTLQEEIRQRKPFVSIEEEAMLSIARTAAVLDHAAGEMLKKHG